VKSGSEAEDESREESKATGEKKDAPIDVNIEKTRSVWGKQAFKKVETFNGEQKAQQSANGREQDTFGQELTQDTTALSSHCCANGDFFFARGGAGEREVCDVGASNEKHETDGP
jgi:hypothetical protein